MTKKTKKAKSEEIETRPDGWERFESAVDAAVKSGPKHREAPKPHKPSGKKKEKPTQKSK